MQEFELSILDWIQAHLRCGFLDVFFTIITKLGDAGWFWIVSGVALLIFRKYRASGVNMLLTMLVGSTIGNNIIKPLVARSRPCWLVDGIDMLISSPSSYSFPSGHTLTAVIAAVCLTKADRRFGYVAIPLATLVAFSRMYHYVHFPTDVLVGALVGLAVSLLSTNLLLPQLKKIKLLDNGSRE